MKPETKILREALQDPSSQIVGLDPDGRRFSASTGVYAPKQRIDLLYPETLSRFRKDGGRLVLIMGGCDFVQRSVKNNPAPVAVHTPDEWEEIYEGLKGDVFAAIPHRSTPFYAEAAVIAHLDPQRTDVDFGPDFDPTWVAEVEDGKLLEMKKKSKYSKELDVDQFDAVVAYYVAAGLVGKKRKHKEPIPQVFTVHNPDKPLPPHVISYNNNCLEANRDFNGLRDTDGAVERMRPLELFNESFREWVAPLLLKGLKDERDPMHETAKLLASIGKDDSKVFNLNVNKAKKGQAALNGGGLDRNLTKATLVVNFTIVDGRVQHRGCIYHNKKTGFTEKKSAMLNDIGWKILGGNGYRIRAQAPAAAIQHNSLPTYMGKLGVNMPVAMKLLRNQFQALSTLMRQYLDTRDIKGAKYIQYGLCPNLL